jgi:tRNA(Ile)-lysidine synthase
LLKQFTEFLNNKAGGTASKNSYAVAVSGGIDSVVLSHLSHLAGIPFVLVHCNFQLRGEESERDEEFVKTLGKKYNVEVLIQKFDTALSAKNNKVSIQEAARELRYNWFQQLIQNKRASYTLLAHHANDNVETLVMNFFRGTGLHGLTSIPEFQSYGSCLRPLLHFTREQIEDFAKEQHLKWVEDSSNASDKYTRNLFRNKILPDIRTVYPQVDNNLLANIDRFKRTDKLYQLLVQGLIKKIEQKTVSGTVQFPVKRLLEYNDTSLIFEIIKQYGFSEKQIPDVMHLLTGESGKYICNDDFRIIRHRHWLIISGLKPDSEIIPVERDANIILFGNKQLQVEVTFPKKIKINKDPLIAQLDSKNITWPLLLRKWKTGDYFYPLGMKKKKKLSRFFIDQKLSKPDKENCWVIESGGRIIWVTGIRIDERFKLTPSTKEVLQLTLSNV